MEIKIKSEVLTKDNNYNNYYAPTTIGFEFDSENVDDDYVLIHIYPNTFRVQRDLLKRVLSII